MPNVVIRIAAETAGAVRDINQVNKALGDQVTAGSKATGALKKAAAPAAAAFAVAGGAIAKFTMAAAEDADSQAHLARSLHKTTGATEAQVKATEDYISKLSSATGVADDEMRPAMEKLSAVSGSTLKGQKLLNIAMDVAASSHVDLTKATAAVVKAEQGRLGALNKLVPGLDEVAVANSDSEAAMASAAKLTGGAASDAAKTYSGQMKIMSNQVAEAEEAIGSAFLPVLDKLMPVLKTITGFVSDNTTAFSFLIGAIAGVSAVLLIANGVIKAYEILANVSKAVTKLWTIEQWSLNAAFAANPIGVIVLAIVGAAGLVYAIKLAYDNCKTFHDVIDKLWDIIKTGVALYLKPLTVTIEAVKDAFNLAKTAFESGFASDWAGKIVTVLQPLIDALRTVARVMGRIAKITFDAFLDGIKQVVEWIGKIDFPSPPKWLTDHLPGNPFGRGGVPAVSVGARGAPGVTASSDTLTINVWGAIDPEGTARQIRRLLVAHDRRQGRIA